jgi:AcrR family transcriptional regulator
MLRSKTEDEVAERMTRTNGMAERVRKATVAGSQPEKKQQFTRKGRATRDRIVKSAAELMYEQGVARTSLQDVQDAALVSGSQMLHYFGDKASLVHEVVAFQSQALFDGQEPWLTRIDSLKGIRAWADRIVNVTRRKEGRGGCPVGSLASELSDLDETVRSETAATFARLASVLRGGLQAMQDRGELKADADVAELALALVTAAEGGLLLAKAYRDVSPMEAALNVVIDRIASLAS